MFLILDFGFSKRFISMPCCGAVCVVSMQRTKFMPDMSFVNPGSRLAIQDLRALLRSDVFLTDVLTKSQTFFEPLALLRLTLLASLSFLPMVPVMRTRRPVAGLMMRLRVSFFIVQWICDFFKK